MSIMLCPIWMYYVWIGLVYTQSYSLFGFLKSRKYPQIPNWFIFAFSCQPHIILVEMVHGKNSDQNHNIAVIWIYLTTYTCIPWAMREKHVWLISNLTSKIFRLLYLNFLEIESAVSFLHSFIPIALQPLWVHGIPFQPLAGSLI